MLNEWRTVRAGIAPQHYTMHYQVWHPEASNHKGTVLCVHGLTRNSYDFDRLAVRLADAGYRVLCPDLVGRGRSDNAPDPLLYNYASYLNDIRMLLKRERARQLIWVGTSMGGILGMTMAAQNPRLISKLVLNDVGAFIPRTALQRIADYVGKPPRFETLADAEAYCRATYGTFGLTDETDWNVFTQNSVRPVPGTRGDSDYVMAYDPALINGFTAAPLTDVNLWPLWESNFAPTLVVRGALSDVLPADVAAAMATCAHAEIVEYANCGHAPSLMVPDQIADVMHFVQTAHKRLTPWSFAAKTMERTANAAQAAWGKLFQAR